MPGTIHAGDIYGAIDATPVNAQTKVVAVAAAYQLTKRATILQRLAPSLPSSATDHNALARQANATDWVVDYSDGRREVMTNAEFVARFDLT